MSGRARSLISSPRRRRRLIAVLGVLAVATIVALLIGFDRNSAQPIATPVTKGTPYVPAPNPKNVRFTKAEAAAAIPIAQQFVRDAVGRKDMRSAWAITAPVLRGGTPRQEWNRGENTEIAPFPLDHARWQLDYNYRTAVGLEIAVYPQAHASIKNPMVYYMELQRPRGKHGRWLVDQWMPAPGSAQVVQGASSSLAGGRSIPSPTTLSSVWLLAPVGLLGLILLIPLLLGLREWRRGRLARRRYEASLPSLPGSRSS
jgi:hypothetical protein